MNRNKRYSIYSRDRSDDRRRFKSHFNLLERDLNLESAGKLCVTFVVIVIQISSLLLLMRRKRYASIVRYGMIWYESHAVADFSFVIPLFTWECTCHMFVMLFPSRLNLKSNTFFSNFGGNRTVGRHVSGFRPDPRKSSCRYSPGDVYFCLDDLTFSILPFVRYEMLKIEKVLKIPKHTYVLMTYSEIP